MKFTVNTFNKLSIYDKEFVAVGDLTHKSTFFVPLSVKAEQNNKNFQLPWKSIYANKVERLNG